MRRVSGRSWRLVAVMALAPAAQADETTFCNAFITSLPYTISAQGHYCFNKNLSTAMTSGAAIRINADFVVLDFNNFKLGGGAAGLTTQAIGVWATGRSNVTIRGGNIRGFYFGILVDGSPIYNHNNLIEGNVLDGNTRVAIGIESGEGHVVRNNLISNTGGSLLAADADGIGHYGDAFSVIQDNVINNTYATVSVRGIYVSGDSVIARNIIRFNTSVDTYGIIAYAAICRENSVIGAAFPFSGYSGNSCPAATGNLSR